MGLTLVWHCLNSLVVWHFFRDNFFYFLPLFCIFQVFAVFLCLEILTSSQKTDVFTQIYFIKKYKLLNRLSLDSTWNSVITFVLQFSWKKLLTFVFRIHYLCILWKIVFLSQIFIFKKAIRLVVLFLIDLECNLLNKEE